MRSFKTGGAILFVVLFLAVAITPAHAVHTALDDYVAAPDSSYGWSLYSTAPLYGFDGAPPQIGVTYTLKMTSQTWQSGKTSPDRSKWTHWITIAVPYNAAPGACFMMIDGGSISSTPADISQYAALSGLLGCSLAYLQYIPNEPLTFSDGVSRTEDSIIAYTFDKYYNLYGTADEDATWPLLLPMVKGAVRGMDAIQEFLKKNNNMTVSDFFIGGASKRGWTTWLTAAVDSRVKAMVPIVIDILNMQYQLPHHKNAYSNYAANDTTNHMYGGYSDAIRDYTKFNVFDRLSTTAGLSMGQIVDPFTYRDRLTMPKLIVNSTGDQFFLPDGIKFYFNQLLGDNHILYVPNTDHTLGLSEGNPDLLVNIVKFISAFVPGSGTTLPKFDWTFQPDGSIRVVMDEQPEAVNVWQAHVETHRDFRLENVGAIWSSSTLTDPDGDGVYVASVPAPSTGWTGFYVSVKSHGIETCSGLRVLPDTYPNASPPVDIWAPAFGNFAASPAVLQTGMTTAITFDASETLAASPVVTVNGHAAALLGSNGLSYSFNYTVSASDPEGPANVEISGTDIAGNPGTTRYPNTVAVNNVPLSFSDAAAAPALAETGTEITISFRASEAVHAVPGVTVNGHSAAFSSLTGLVYQYKYTVAADDPDGFADIEVAATDFAAESVTKPLGDILSVDNTPPSFTNVVATPTTAKDGTVITLSFDASEALYSLPLVVTYGNGLFALQSSSGNSYVYTYTVGAAESEGPVSVLIEGYDILVHQRRATFTGVFAVDRTAPVLSNLTATPAAAKEGAVVTVGFDASEELASGAGASVNGHASVPQEKNGLSYTFAYTVQAGDPEGPATVAVQGTDPAGNPVSASSGAILTVDKTAPGGSLTINRGVSSTNSATASLTLSCDDHGGTGVSLMRLGTDGVSWTPWEAFATAKSFALPTGDGVKTVYAQYSDKAGNVSSETISDTVFYDTTPCTGSIVINNNARATNKVDATLSLAWDDGAGSGVSRMRFSTDGSTWTLWEVPVASRPQVLPAGNGYKTVRVQYLDKAQNRSAVYNDYILLDTVPPTGGILINNGDAMTTNSTVTLTLNWDDVGSGVTRMRFSDNGSNWTVWESQKATRSYKLPDGLGYHTVRVQYTDAAQNYSVAGSDYIKVIALP